MENQAQKAEKDILALEDEYVRAEVNRDDSALIRLLDERFSFNHLNGTIIGKDEFIRDVMKMNMSGQALGERSILLEREMALIFGTTELRFASERDGEDSRAYYRYTSTYIKRKDGWKFLALQMVKRK